MFIGIANELTFYVDKYAVFISKVCADWYISPPIHTYLYIDNRV